MSDDYRAYLIQSLLQQDNKKLLIDIHKEYYSGLLSCRTLEEAKKLYPEFNRIYDLSNIACSTKNNHVLNRVREGVYEGLAIENLTLELLKKYYAELLPKSDKSKYCGIGTSAIRMLLRFAGIVMPKEYEALICQEKLLIGYKKRFNSLAN